jgi:hypothetical protein
MDKLKWLRAMACLAFAFCFAFLNHSVASAQDRNSPAEAATNAKNVEINHEVQLYLLVASNKSFERNNLPQALDGVIKQLKSTLPFTNYHLTTTLLHRVSDNGSLQVSGVIGSSPFGATTPAIVPTYYEFTLTKIKSVASGGEQPFVHIQTFRFTQRVPIQTSSTRSDSGGSFPVINYEPTGITTELSLREGAPTIIGTIPIGLPDESVIIIASVKRIMSR